MEYKKLQKLDLEGSLPAINEIIANSKTHWSKYSRIKKNNTSVVALACLSQRIKPIEKSVKILFSHYCKNKRRDPDNVAGGSQKIILDGLVKAEILKNDTFEFVNSLHHEFELDKKNPRIEVFLYE